MRLSKSDIYQLCHLLSLEPPVPKITSAVRVRLCPLPICRSERDISCLIKLPLYRTVAFISSLKKICKDAEMDSLINFNLRFLQLRGNVIKTGAHNKSNDINILLKCTINEMCYYYNYLT